MVLASKDRMKSMLWNPNDAELMRWHQLNCKIDGMIRHSTDAHQWKTFDSLHPEFAKDLKNVRFAFSTDGMNPFRDLASLYTMYNLPTWIWQNWKYIMLNVLLVSAIVNLLRRRRPTLSCELLWPPATPRPPWVHTPSSLFLLAMKTEKFWIS